MQYTLEELLREHAHLRDRAEMGDFNAQARLVVVAREIRELEAAGRDNPTGKYFRAEEKR